MYVNRKKNVLDYARTNIFVAPVSKEYNYIKNNNRVRYIKDLPESWQVELKKYIREIEKASKIEYVRLVGSLPTGNGLMPGVTPEKFWDLRKIYAPRKSHKKQSDIDLVIVFTEPRKIPKRSKSKTVNIECLPTSFQAGVVIYRKGKWTNKDG